MIPQDPVSVSVIAFLVVFAVGTAWLMVGRQALANAARNTANAGTRSRGGVLIGMGGLPGAGTNEYARKGRGRLELGKGGLPKPQAGELADKKEIARAKPAENLNEAVEDDWALEPQAIDSPGQRFSEPVPSHIASGFAVRAGRPVSGPSRPLSSDQQWSRITEIVREDIESAERADSFHAAANQQLDAVDYAIARLREEMESISAGGNETTRRREHVSRPVSRPARSGFVPLLGAGERNAVAQAPNDHGEAIVSRSNAELGPEIAAVRESAPAKPAGGKPNRKRRGKAKRAKEKSIAA